MTERERTIIRVTGLAVHACGLVVLLVAIGQGSLQGGAIGVLMFLVGGAWGWGMVLAAANRERAEQEAARAGLIRERQGFTARFDDEPEHVISPPPGAGREG